MSHVTGSGGIRWGGKGVTCNGVWWDSRGRKVSHVTGSGGIRGGGKGVTCNGVWWDLQGRGGCHM